MSRGGFGMNTISDRINSIAVDPPSPGEYRTVAITDIEVQPQVREVFDAEKLKALKQVIERDGQRQPVECYYDDGRYVLLTGERRYRAVKELGRKMVDVRIRAKPEPIEAIYLQVSENEDREPLTRIEIAKAIAALTAAGEKNAAIARKLGIGEKMVPRYRAIGKASERVHDLYYKGVMDIRSLQLLAYIDEKWPAVLSEIAPSVVEGTIGRAELESIHGRLKDGEEVNAVLARPPQQAPANDKAQYSEGGSVNSAVSDAGSQSSGASQGGAEATDGLGMGNASRESLSAQEGGSAGQESPDSAPAGEGASDNGTTTIKKEPSKEPDKTAISVSHHYEETHISAKPEGVVIEVKGKLDNGTPIRGTVMMDRVDEVSDYVWVKPDDQESRPVKLDAKRLKILSVTGS